MAEIGPTQATENAGLLGGKLKRYLGEEASLPGPKASPKADRGTAPVGREPGRGAKGRDCVGEGDPLARDRRATPTFYSRQGLLPPIWPKILADWIAKQEQRSRAFTEAETSK